MSKQLRYYLDLDDENRWLIKSIYGDRFIAGYNKQKVVGLISRLNEAHRPNIESSGNGEIWVCWNCHGNGEKCEFVKEI